MSWNWNEPEPSQSFEDPYFRWAEHSGWRGLRRHLGEQPDELRFVVEVNDRLLACLSRRALPKSPSWYENQGIRAYRVPFDERSTFVEALLAAQCRWELAVPFRPAEAAAEASPLGSYISARNARSFSNKPVGPVLTPKGARVPIGHGAIAVIDDAFPFLHDAFSVAGDGLRTRILALWDQGDDPKAAPWRSPVEGTQGRLLRQSDIDGLLQMRNAGEASDLEIYKRLSLLIDWNDPRRRVRECTHGSQVADTAGGWRDPAQPGRVAPDAAANAPLLFVQLPSLSAADASGSSLSAQVLDAVHFCRREVKEGPLLINLSYGTTASSKLGDSLLERALDELVKSEKGRLVLVLAAGNARESGCHVRRLLQPGKGARLNLRLARFDSTDSFVEFWWAQQQAADLQIRVKPPEQDWSPWVGADQQTQLFEAAMPTQPLASLQLVTSPGQSSKKSLGLLAIAPTCTTRNDAGPLATAGHWELELKANGKVAVDVCLEWDEIDDRNPLDAMTALLDIEAGDRDETLNSLGHGDHSLVVGAFRRSDGQALRYSGRSVEKQRPQILAVAEECDAIPGLYAAAVRNGSVELATGTSIAAAVVTRRAFNLLSSRKKLRPVQPGELAKALLDAAQRDSGQDPRGPALIASALPKRVVGGTPKSSPSSRARKARAD